MRINQLNSINEMSAAEILNTIQVVERDLEQLEDWFKVDLVKLKECAKNIEIKGSSVKALIKNSQRHMEDEASKYDFFMKDIESNREYSQNLRMSIDALSHEEAQIKNNILSCQKSLGKAKKHVDMLSNEREHIEELKNVIKTFQVTTKTSFVFSSKGEKGIIMTKNGPKPFDFPKDTPQSEIVNKLWEMQTKE